jgi:CheY-like chemotaxis protein
MNDSGRRRPFVLLVDDCGDQRDLYELLLESEFDIAAVSRGEHALALAAARRPDVVVLDIQMPGMDGFETCRRLKADPDTASIPIVMLTGGDYVPADALVAGVFAVLEKPCPERRLVETVDAALAARRRR